MNLGSRRKVYLQNSSQQESKWQWVPHLFSSPGVFRRLLWFLCRPPKCWPKINRMPDISPAMMHLFRIVREFQFRVCNHIVSKLPYGKEGRRKGNWEGHGQQSPWHFIGWVLVRKVEESYFFLLGSSMSQHVVSYGLLTLFNWSFCLLMFLTQIKHWVLRLGFIFKFSRQMLKVSHVQITMLGWKFKNGYDFVFFLKNLQSN